MKKLSLIVVAALLSVPAFAANYTVDGSHSNVTFGVRHLLSKMNGEFTKYEGHFSFDEKKLGEAKVTFKIDASSVDTRNQKRDEHLRSPDFFDTAKFPELTFVSKKVIGSGKKFKLEGDLTIHGVTKPVTFEVEYLGTAADPWGGVRAGFVAKTKISRKAYGLAFSKMTDGKVAIVGDDVEIELNVEGLQDK